MSGPERPERGRWWWLLAAVPILCCAAPGLIGVLGLTSLGAGIAFGTGQVVVALLLVALMVVLVGLALRRRRGPRSRSLD